MSRCAPESGPAIRAASATRGAPRLRRCVSAANVSILVLAFAACSGLHRGQSATSAASNAGASSSANSSAEGTPAAESTPGEAGAEAGAPDASAAQAQGDNNQSDSGETAGAPNASPPPGATVSITYAHRGDYLAGLSVSKFSGAETVETRGVDAQHVASIIRFDGGITVWEIKPESGMFSKLPVVGSGSQYAVKSVTYGKLPDHFAQTTPDSGSPEPLEPGHYYVFAAQRASGTMSYEAVRVEDDGSLDAYEAEPRAGTSYLLCCNLSADFVQPPSPLMPGASGDNP